MKLGKILFHSAMCAICTIGAVLAAQDLADALSQDLDKEWEQAAREDQVKASEMPENTDIPK